MDTVLHDPYFQGQYVYLYRDMCRVMQVFVSKACLLRFLYNGLDEVPYIVPLR